MIWNPVNKKPIEDIYILCMGKRIGNKETVYTIGTFSSDYDKYLFENEYFLDSCRFIGWEYIDNLCQKR